MTALVGPTGCGKTTLGRLLFRFYDPRKGSILVGGKDIRTVKQRSLRSYIGVVPQDTVLFNDTLRHNVNYGRLGAELHELEDAVAAARLTKFIASLTEGWETVVGERGLRLSGGEKQRVSISRALLKDPPVVLLDEATSALDTVTEKSVQDALSELGKGRTQIVIAHRLTTIMNADQIVVMDQGTIVEKGRHEELLAKRGAYYKLWNVQLRAEEEHAKATIRGQITKAAAESKEE